MTYATEGRTSERLLGFIGGGSQSHIAVVVSQNGKHIRIDTYCNSTPRYPVNTNDERPTLENVTCKRCRQYLKERR